MLKMQDQVVSASPVALGTPGNPAVEDWDTMMRALRQRIGTIAAASPAALSSAGRRDSLNECGLALAQLSAQLDQLDTGPAAHRQREHELKQAAHLLARAQRVSVGGGVGGGSTSTG